MSGMKFRRTCSSCQATFFSSDRKAAYCPKCTKQKIVKFGTAEPRAQTGQVAHRPGASAARPELREVKPRRPPKANLLTPELRERITELYHSESADTERPWREIRTKISEQLWIKPQLVAEVLRSFRPSQPRMTEEQKARAIEMYRQFVEMGHRPEGGRRRAISVTLGVSYKQVMKTIREWAQSEHQKSPTPTPGREQLFEIEKLYWDEIKKQEHRLGEIPELIANKLGYVTRWQVLRWLDTIHDDERDLAQVPDPPPAIQQQILEAYAAYLAAPAPPEQGLHQTIAGRLENVTPQQVHKVLLHYRHQVRSAYPLI